jgi:glycosyltransferase involved in cell wall biosynthesis
MKATILALGLYRSSGGPSKSVAAFQRALSADVVSWVDPMAYAREPLIWDGVKCRHYIVTGSSRPVLRQLCYPQRRGLAEAERIVAGSDLVSSHSFWRWHNVWLERVAALHRVPYWFVPHGALDPYVMETEMLVKRAFLSLGGRRFLKGARAVVCATQREYDKLAQLMPQARPVILPWPLDDADFRVQDAAQRAIVRNRLRIPADALVLLSFGRLHPMKRPLETIVAFAAGAPPSAHLLVVGNECGVTAADCRTMAEKHGVAERVHLTGPAYGAVKAGYLDAADVYVSLSHRENFNFTAAEALATGLPVMLSPGNDLGPDLEPADCGWLLASPDAAAEAMASLGGLSPEHISAKGERGRAWAEANLRYDVFATRLQEAAARLVASG